MSSYFKNIEVFFFEGKRQLHESDRSLFRAKMTKQFGVLGRPAESSYLYCSQL